ncbi:Phosphoglucomutase [Neochlamydia sp. TUME1]|uniref:phosphoglucomutase (alpha-D-glucose-1,6-bisphosphate-dependent) n=1 Tax=Neochlamydia sp. TUME1 TaxID=1478174 RepID=UPI00057F3E8F|nr:phosphoglucomutase (alpha-D-glucose-1,6-bisphosphate-dependent) [Neochlamydia sp. TUME1]KIC74941.1 Phosphoglucomutase [Neochlamydia sp. TUME1]
MRVSPLAGKISPSDKLVNIPQLITAYYAEKPDPLDTAQQVAFGTSGHRGSALQKSFNEHHILAISQAICQYRKQQGIDGPLFLGMDTHALSKPALMSAIEVLAANGIEILLAEGEEYTPTPVISHAIVSYNRHRTKNLADGIVITPSHNPPSQGGIKYNPPSGGPADLHITQWIETKANELMRHELRDLKRIPYEKALNLSTTKRYNYLEAYVSDLKNVINMEIIQKSQIKLGVDPLGGAGIHYWEPIAERYKLNLTLVNKAIDPTFQFMTLDWDGQIRMDPSSAYAMQGLITLKNRFDIAFACDTDHDRHGIVTKSSGLLPPNHYLSAAIFYLFQHRPLWSPETAIGKTLVSSQMIDRVATQLNRKIYEVPVGFKWFVDGLLNESLSFCGEESAGASFARLDGKTWTTDKDGIILSLLAAEMTAQQGKDPGEIYQDLTREFGNPAYDRVEAPASLKQRQILKNFSALQIQAKEIAGEAIQGIFTHAAGNNAAIGGVKVITENGWFAARPSGTEDIYKIYGESFRGQEHLEQILNEAQSIVGKAFEEAYLLKTP